ncbi:hypothetical protein CEXT_241421 [Caerostris extrusa]|uniref:Transposase n=1 Tax=Caerostris extrusa TaxID=172846 RepID=A0AAV4TLS6_CAEEX|nr:hypothetical protein CEXT_241421 [Caerostris extrusa]
MWPAVTLDLITSGRIHCGHSVRLITARNGRLLLRPRSFNDKRTTDCYKSDWFLSQTKQLRIMKRRIQEFGHTSKTFSADMNFVSWKMAIAIPGQRVQSLFVKCCRQSITKLVAFIIQTRLRDQSDLENGSKDDPVSKSN